MFWYPPIYTSSLELVHQALLGGSGREGPEAAEAKWRGIRAQETTGASGHVIGMWHEGLSNLWCLEMVGSLVVYVCNCWLLIVGSFIVLLCLMVFIWLVICWVVSELVSMPKILGKPWWTAIWDSDRHLCILCDAATGISGVFRSGLDPSRNFSHQAVVKSPFLADKSSINGSFF